MPSIWEYIRLDVLHVPGVATRVSTRPLPSPARRRHSRSAATGHPRPRALDPPARARIPPRALESPRARENPPRAEIIRAGGSVAPSLFLLV